MPAEGSEAPVDIPPQRPRRYTVIFTPVPQTLTSGFSGLSTIKSGNSRHWLSAPEPTSLPSTGWPSTYTTWLMSSLSFVLSAAAATSVSASVWRNAIAEALGVEEWADCQGQDSLAS